MSSPSDTTISTVAHNATTAETQASMRSFAEWRALDYEQTGLFPPISPHLGNGHGVGSHPAGRPAAGGWFTDGFTMRPERFSENLCRGRLPGGAEGTLAHHGYLVLWHSPGDPPRSLWNVSASTVVVIPVPEGARVARRLTIKPRDYRGTTKVVKLGNGTARLVGPARFVPLETHPEVDDRFEVDTYVTDADHLGGLFDAELVAAMLAAPKFVVAEVRPGLIELHVPGYEDDPAVLESLCRLGSALAAGVRRVAEGLPSFDPALRLPGPWDTELQRWLDHQVPKVAWPAPPPDAPSAVAAYREIAAGEQSLTDALGAHSVGDKISKARSVVLALIFGFVAAMVAGGVAAAAFTALAGPLGLAAGPLAAVVAGTAVSLVVLRMGRRKRQGRKERISDEAAGRFAQHLGLEAFAREYARSRGLALEDADALRNRLDSPLAGVPGKSLHGDLGDGVVGRLVFWVDDTDVTEVKPYNVAIVAGQRFAGEAGPGYEAFAAGGFLMLAERIDPSGRSSERLDALRAEVVRVADRER